MSFSYRYQVIKALAENNARYKRDQKRRLRWKIADLMEKTRRNRRSYIPIGRLSSLCWRFSVYCRRRRRDANARIHVHWMQSKRRLTAVWQISPVVPVQSTVQSVVGRINYGEIWRDSQGQNLFLLPQYMKIKCSYRHFKMFQVISTVREDITDQNSYLCTTRLLLLLCISLWRHW